MAHTVKNKEKEKFDSLAVRVPKILIKAREIFPGFFAQESISASIYIKRQEQINSIYREIDNLTNRVEVLEEITKAPAEQELENGALGKKLINQYSRVIERQK